MQRFTIHTLIDITATGIYRHQSGQELAKLQQQNFSTLVQTIGMRANPLFDQNPTIDNIDSSSIGFGVNYNGIQRVWTFEFNVEYQAAFVDNCGRPQGLLDEDLHFVPIITGLTETVNIKIPVFDIKTDTDRNTIILVNNINIV